MEKRHHRRFTVDCSDIRGKMLFTSEVKVIDVSDGGIFVKADRRFEIGREYSMKIEYGDKVLSLDGIVVWSALGESGEGPCGRSLPIYRAGIRFTDVASEKLVEFIGYIGSDKHDCREPGELNKGSEQRLATGLYTGAPETTVPRKPASYRLKKISLRGLLMESERELAIDSRLPMELSLPGNRLVGCWGKVVYCLAAETEGGSPYNIGIEFIDLPENDRQRLDQSLRLIERRGDNSACFVTVQPV